MLIGFKESIDKFTSIIKVITLIWMMEKKDWQPKLAAHRTALSKHIIYDLH